MVAVLNPQVLIAADDMLARAGLVALLDTTDSVDVVGTSPLASVALGDAISLHQPDMLLCDVGWGDADAEPAVLRMVTQAARSIPVIWLTASQRMAEAIMRQATASAFGLLPRNSEQVQIETALDTVWQGLVVISPGFLGRNAVVAGPLAPDVVIVDTLTPRENEVLQCVAQGLTNKAIARQLDITEHTVKFHLNAVMSKLDVQSRTEAVVRAAQAGLLML